MSFLCCYQNKKVILPEPEKPDGLTVEQLIEEIDSFYRKLEKANGIIVDSAEGYHLNLLAKYPVSLCSQHITENLGLLIAIVYYDGIPTDEEIKEYEGKLEIYDKEYLLKPEQTFSMEDLALVFNRSKATVYDVCTRYKDRANQVIRDARLRVLVHEKAMAELVKEERERIKMKEQTSKQPNEPHKHRVEDRWS